MIIEEHLTGSPVVEFARLAIVVVDYESADLIEEWHGPLHSSPHVTVIVDNSISDAGRRRSREMAERAGATYLWTGSNIGFGDAANLGARNAEAQGCTHVLFLNPDASIAPEDVTLLLERSVASPSAILSPMIENQRGEVWFAGARMDLRTGAAWHVTTTTPSTENDWITGACMMVPLAVWNALGGFSTKYFLYWEDIDFTYRWKRTGGSLDIQADIVATHSVGGTQGTSQGKSPIYAQYNVRNRILFASRNVRSDALPGWLLHTPRYARAQARRVDRSLGKAVGRTAVAKGLAEALLKFPVWRLTSSASRRVGAR